MEKEKEIDKISWLIWFNYFNLMDALLTVYSIQEHGFHEVNPGMSYLMSIHPMAFFMFKISFGALCTLYFLKRSKIRLIKVLTYIFAGVVGWNFSLLAVRLLGWI